LAGSTFSFGGQTGVDNLDSIVIIDRLSDELGGDTISFGVAVGFAMELFERGLLSLEDEDGLDLSFGNHESRLTLPEKTALREGFGEVLAGGVRLAAVRLGKNTEYHAVHVIGLELAGIEPGGRRPTA
jgi:aldehyde:ferredoxin oxidoreductase